MKNQHRSTKRRATAEERFWEILPGALEWGALIALPLLSWQAPFVVSYIIVVYSLLWFEKSIHVTFHLIHTFRHMNWAARQPWLARLKELSHPEQALAQVTARIAALNQNKLEAGTARVSKTVLHYLEVRKHELTQALAQGAALPNWQEVRHLIVIPTYNEPTEVLVQSIDAIARSRFPLDRLMILVGVEERAGAAGQEKASALRARFQKTFGQFWTVTHPDGIIGEAKVKSANATYALKSIVPELRRLAIPFDRVLVSNFDSDTQPHPDYFAILTEKFVLEPKRQRASYQPIPVYHNNIWYVPMMPRVSATGSSFWQMIEASRTHRLVSFSSHSLPLQAVLDVGGWDVTRISEDSRIFWQCYMHYHGDYHVVPLPTTVSMDAVQAGSWFKTLVNLYKQKRRWAWGAENMAYLGSNFFGKNHVRSRLSNRLAHIGRMIEGYFSWATAAIVLAVGGWLPGALGGPEFRDTVLGQNFSIVSRFLLTLALAGVVVSIVISARMIPERPVSVPRRRWIFVLGQWLLTPLVTILYGSIPAIDAHTRLMLGRYMEFQVMPKVRTTTSTSRQPVAASSSAQ